MFEGWPAVCVKPVAVPSLASAAYWFAPSCLVTSWNITAVSPLPDSINGSGCDDQSNVCAVIVVLPAAGFVAKLACGEKNIAPTFEDMTSRSSIAPQAVIPVTATVTFVVACGTVLLARPKSNWL